MRTILRSTTAASTLLALLLAGCGGGGHASNALPATATNAPVTGGGTSSSTRTPASFTIVIPSGGSKTAANKRSPKYISAATASIGVSVQPATGGTPITAGIDVNSTNCPTLPAGETCTLTVQAPVGQDTFTVTMYDGVGETGNVLGSGTETQTVVLHVANTFPLTLSGTVASLTLALANPSLPYVSGGSTTLSVSAYDAGNSLIVGTYSSAITLSSPSGLTLNTSSITDSSTIVTASYNGVSKTPLTVQALTTNAGGTAVTGSATVTPVSHVVNYTGTAATGGQGLSDTFRIIKGPDGAFYFGDIGATQSMGSSNIVTGTTAGAIGRIDQNTGTISEVQIFGIDPTSLTFVGNDLYFCELANGLLGRITGAAAGGFSANNYSENLLPNTPPAGTLTPGTGHQYDAPRDIVAVNGLLYVTMFYHQDMIIVDPSKWSNSSVAADTVITNPNPNNGNLAGIAYSATSGTLSMISTNSDVYAYTPGSGATALTDQGFLNPTGAIPGSGRFVAAGADGNFYYTIQAGGDFTTPGGIFQAAPGANIYDGAFKALPVAYPGWGPDSIHTGSGTSVVSADLAYGAIDSYDTSAQQFTIYPITVLTDNLQSTGAQDVADDGNGSYWFTYGVNAGETLSSTVTIGRLALAGWTLLPDTTVTQNIDGTGPNSATLVSVAGTGASSVAVGVAGPQNCMAVPSSVAPTTFIVTGISPGPCTISAFDGTRTITRNYTVTSSSATITSRKRISK